MSFVAPLTVLMLTLPTVLKDEETTGPLDPANIPEKKKSKKERKNKERKERKERKRSVKKESEWIKHVKAFYANKKKGNPGYKYSQALKEAKSTYKKQE